VLDTVQSLLLMLDRHSAGLVCAFVALHVVFAVLCLPCSPFTLVAGSIWGLWPGLLISSGAAALASGATFAIGRSSLGRQAGSLFTRWSLIRRATELARKVLGEGWESVVLVQGNPLVPASSLGYVFGMTRVHAGTFIVTTFLATFPLQAVLVATGAMARDAIVLRELHGVVVFSMILATALLGVWILVRRRLRSAAAHTLISEGTVDAE
jgi:uncharacterized membrane protein YdjX (TVP38/TMEM64 family)